MNKFIFESYSFDIKPENYNKYYLYRYFSKFDRLKSFLTDGIYLSRADKFSDHLECVDYDNLIEINKRKDFIRLNREHNPHISSLDLEKYKNKADSELDLLADKIQDQQQKYHITCWYITNDDVENELMWKSYGKDYLEDNKGFLVKINLKDFISHLPQISILNENLGKVIYGTVSYYNFNENKNIQKVKYTGFRKHSSFKDESEFRMIYKNNFLKIMDTVFLKTPKSFYWDITIIAHPEYELDEYECNKKQLEKDFEVSLELSKLYIWYKLKKNKILG